MSSGTHPNTEQQIPRDIKQEDASLEQSGFGNSKQDAPTEYTAPGDFQSAATAKEPSSHELDPTPKAVEEEPKSSDQPHETHQEPAAEKGKSSITELASSAATTATTAALGMKDNVFSMFGGGAKKEKKEPKDEPEEASGSAKAQKEQKESEAEAVGEVSIWPGTEVPCLVLTHIFRLG